MKKYLRYCDICEKEINPYAEGAITLFRDIRFGVGGRYKDYIHKGRNAVKLPDDLDGFGKSWKRDEDAEFSFCCLDHCLQFIINAYMETKKK